MANVELNILKAFLKHNRYIVVNDLLEIQFLSHPNKSSLNAITDTLDYFHIDNIAAEVSIQNLEEIKNPFIAHLQTPNGEHFY